MYLFRPQDNGCWGYFDYRDNIVNGDFFGHNNRDMKNRYEKLDTSSAAAVHWRDW